MRIFRLSMGLLCMAIPFFVGVMLIYRGSLNISGMDVIKGTVFSKERGYKYAYKGGAYYLSFGIKELPVNLAISYISKNDIYADSTFNFIDTGKTYTFYVDPTFPISDNRIMGIAEIDYNGKIIYKRSKKRNLYGGFFFCLLGVIGSVLIYKFDKKNNSTKQKISN